MTTHRTGETTMPSESPRRFRVALSFPGERRGFVQQVADLLAMEYGKRQVLYDHYHDAEFARIDLDVHLPNLYGKETELIAVFLCPEYAQKRWCGLELRHIRQLIGTPEQKRIMLLSFGDPGDLSGLGILPGDGYLDIQSRGFDPEKVCARILDRLKNWTGLQATASVGTPQTSGQQATAPKLADILKQLSLDGTDPSTFHPQTRNVSPPRVYISYCLRTPNLIPIARHVADQLGQLGIDSRIDRYYGESLYGFTPPPPAPPRDAWDLWQEQQIQQADRIIIFCTREYLESPDDSGIARDLRYMQADALVSPAGLNKFIPVGFGPYQQSQNFIPPFIRGATYYDLTEQQGHAYGFKALVNRLKTEFPAAQAGQPADHKPEQRPNPTGTAPMPIRPRAASAVKGRVHAAIITIRPDEYEAMEEQLDNVESITGSNNYKYAELPTQNGDTVAVALTRMVGQGDLKAGAVAANIIHDLDPAWILLVGIAGGVPDFEYSLGDVVIATYLHDFSFTAAKAGSISYQTYGGNMHPEVDKFLSTCTVGNDGKTLRRLAGFDTDELLAHPAVYRNLAIDECFYGSDAHQGKVKASIEMRFPDGRRQGGPVVWQGPCANGNVLVKDSDLLEQWQQFARQVVQVETELSGVYEAARSLGRTNYPVLAIRGLSDIIGFVRDPAWTGYACKTAAAYAAAILRSGFIDFAKNLPNPQ